MGNKHPSDFADRLWAHWDLLVEYLCYRLNSTLHCAHFYQGKPSTFNCKLPLVTCHTYTPTPYAIDGISAIAFHTMTVNSLGHAVLKMLIHILIEDNVRDGGLISTLRSFLWKAFSTGDLVREAPQQNSQNWRDWLQELPILRQLLTCSSNQGPTLTKSTRH